MNRLLINCLLLFFISFIITPQLIAYTEHQKYFHNTDYELDVYTIRGEQPGKTLMIIGGIQGDESAGYLTADLFVDISLKKGNLIIIPRANLPTITQNKRLINYDMNRRFNHPESNIFEDKVVDIITENMHKSDMLLNLHEGGGYYRNTYIDAMKNPMKYGQCIIADADTFWIEKSKQALHLGDIAREICDEVNQFIDNELYHYHFNNHNTISPATKHAEQRQSASYYGLTKASIPAFGIEVSKQLPSLEMKITHLTLVINSFLRHLDIIPQFPKIKLDKPDFDFLTYRINGLPHIAYKGDVIKLNKSSELEVEYIKGNYERGYLIDIAGHGTTNDLNKAFMIKNDTKITIRKDGEIIGEIPIIIQDESKVYQGIVLMINGIEHTLEPGQSMNINKNDKLKIVKLLNVDHTYEANFLGWANPLFTANDIGYEFYIDDSLIKKFSPDGGKSWLIDILKNKKKVSSHRFYVKDEPPAITKKDTPFKLQYIHNKQTLQITEGDTLFCKNGDTLYLDKPILSSDAAKIIKTKDIPFIKINIAGFISDPKKDGDDKGIKFTIDSNNFISKFDLGNKVYELQVNLYEKRYALFYFQIIN